MLTALLYFALALLIFTTLFVVVRTILFQWSQGVRRGDRGRAGR